MKSIKNMPTSKPEELYTLKEPKNILANSDSGKNHAFAGFCGGLASVLFTHPLEVIRIHKQREFIFIFLCLFVLHSDFT